MAVKLLCIGDIHLGRWPSGLPEEVVQQAGKRVLTPAAAWQRSVEVALELNVDAVLLAGDVVEEESDFYEAFRDLEAGVTRLTEVGVKVLGVAGNHDVTVLPRLAEVVSGFHLLGSSGVWEEDIITGHDGTEVRVLGWSYPKSIVRDNPLKDIPSLQRDSRPTIGLLHCDRDQSGSRYAPVTSTDLEAAPVDAWLLGHIHRPDPLEGPRPIGYLGSLVGLDPTEQGSHGPWIVEIQPGAGIFAEHLPLAPLRWETLEISIDELTDPPDIHPLITKEMRALHEEIVDLSPYYPRAVGCRLYIKGRTPHRQAIEKELKEASLESASWEWDGILYFIERAIVDTEPPIDLERLAEGTDPVGLLARKVLILRRSPDDQERRELVHRARTLLAEVVNGRVYRALQPEPPSEERVASLLEEAALRAIEALLAQRGDK